MIVLTRIENIEVYQVPLTLKIKTKQSPFIAILILALELDEISEDTLKQNLLSALPLRACDNLLKRLEQQGYIKNKNSGRQASYVLTDLGKESAINKSFWIGEKGLYKVFVVRTNLFEQRIIKVEKVDRSDKNEPNEILTTPKEIKKYEKHILSINKSEIIIEDIEDKCFKLNSIACDLEITSKEEESTLKIYHNKQNLFNYRIEIDEIQLQEELLVTSYDFEYDEEKKVILTPFNKDNISFNRKVKISNPVFKNITFQPIELDAMLHIPSDMNNANLWYYELLFKNINQYFLDETSFSEFAEGLTLPIEKFYNLNIPNREEMIAHLKYRNDAFYERIKLETIDYLNY